MSSEAEQSLRQLKVYKGLVEVSALINAITDFNELLAAILDVSRRVMLAEASSLFLSNSEGNLELVVASGSGAGESPKEKIVVPRGQAHVFYARILGDLRPFCRVVILGIKVNTIALVRRIFPVLFRRQGGFFHIPFAFGRHGVESPMQKHAELGILKPLHVGIVLLDNSQIIGH